MMHRIFVDANVVLDWLNADSERNAESTECLEIIASMYNKPYISPTTFCIVYYMATKKLKSRMRIHELLEEAFQQFYYTDENENIVTLAMNSAFKDWEDALQYYSSQTVKADAIVTYNLHDYMAAKIPVLHPGEFIQLHKFDI